MKQDSLSHNSNGDTPQKIVQKQQHCNKGVAIVAILVEKKG